MALLVTKSVVSSVNDDRSVFECRPLSLFSVQQSCDDLKKVSDEFVDVVSS